MIAAETNRRHEAGRRRLRRLTVLGIVAGLAPLVTGGQPIDAGRAGRATTYVAPATLARRPAYDGTNGKPMPFPGPDTTRVFGGDRYVTYGATTRARRCPATAHGRRCFVPYVIHGRRRTVGMDSTIDGDAMPKGPGRWAKKGGGVWAPSVYYHDPTPDNDVPGRYFLFYTASHRDSTPKRPRKCIGVAYSPSSRGAFARAKHSLVCPKTRWAIDADVTKGPGGAVFMTYRDGRRAQGRESALTVARLRINGVKVDVRGDPHVLLHSERLTWPDVRSDEGVTVIENPSLIHAKGVWWLFYSGNGWRTRLYATGIARCGAALKGTCKPVRGVDRPYFGYKGKKGYPRGHRPVAKLPGNHPGPGGMSVFRARGGRMWAVWNYLTCVRPDDPCPRHSRTGKLLATRDPDHPKIVRWRVSKQ